MSKWWGLLLLFLLVALPGNSVTGQTPTVFKEISVGFDYGREASFRVNIEPAASVRELYLYLQGEGEALRVEKIGGSPEGAVTYRYNLQQKPLRPFARFEYWFKAVTSSGENLQSEKNRFSYEDNRVTWHRIDETRFQVNWIDGDLVFGQQVMNAVQAGLKTGTAILPVLPPLPLRVYVYSRPSDLQSALLGSQQNWVAGHASPDLGVILVTIPDGPERQMLLNQQVPHEIMHILMYQAAGSAYTRLPTWLVEGMASVTELNPNPDYGRAIDRAVKNHTLHPMATLCTSFPQDASGAFLAYAQSASFVRYLSQTFGNNAFQEIISSSVNGLNCEEATLRAFGAPISSLEVRWQQEMLGVDAGLNAMNNIAPYLLLASFVIAFPIAATLWINRQKSGRSLDKR